MTAEYKNWQEDFVDINFTDQRLKSRFFKIIDAFAASPGKSTWAATGSRSSAKAAYRFFSNSEISKDELLDSISRATVEKIKCADAEWILAVQDTTAVGFGDRKAIQGMGYDCSTEQRGMLVHSCIAVTDQGIPLGIIYQETNTREKPKDDSQTKEQKRSRPIEEKENFRWLDSMRETLLRMPADIPILTVCDREGDFYEFFSEAADLKANFLIRIVQNRMVDDGKKIFHELRSSPVAGSMVVRMSRNPKEHIPSRNIKMDYHCKKVTIYRPQRRKEKHLREKLELTAIYVHESGKKGTEWFLLTTVTVKSEKEIEKNQAREYGRLSFLTLLYSVIAMQILNLTYLGKICPEISSGIVFVEEEWKVLCCCARKSKEIPESYSLKEAIYDLGVLGGTKGAPSDGMPGVRSIWQGLDVLYSLLAYRNYLV
ncbi:IS4 family transposase [Blautia sp. OM05-6]|uniref:IS4 family transposase n=2 Tax=Blautia TaxID=572511 RepID=UPI000E4B86EC|nr:IS4 family transposase [Blautia sp. OM05-6]